MKIATLAFGLTPTLDSVGGSSAGSSGPNLSSLVDSLLALINNLIPLVIGLGLLAFLWGVAQFIRSGEGDARARDDAKWMIGAGIIGLFVMVSVWGLVNFVHATFGLNDNQLPSPKFDRTK